MKYIKLFENIIDFDDPENWDIVEKNNDSLIDRCNGLEDGLYFTHIPIWNNLENYEYFYDGVENKEYSLRYYTPIKNKNMKNKIKMNEAFLIFSINNGKIKTGGWESDYNYLTKSYVEVK